jgi:hypothetical protein
MKLSNHTEHALVALFWFTIVLVIVGLKGFEVWQWLNM